MFFKVFMIIPKDIYEKSSPIDLKEYIDNIMLPYSTRSNHDINISGYDLHKIYYKCCSGDINTFKQFCEELNIDNLVKPETFPICDDYLVHTDNLIYDISGTLPLAPIDNDDNTNDSMNKNSKQTIWDNMLWVISLGNYDNKIKNIKNARAEFTYITLDHLKIGENIMPVEQFKECFDLHIFPAIIDKNGILHINKKDGEWCGDKYCPEEEFYKILNNSFDDYIIIIDCYM